VADGRHALVVATSRYRDSELRRLAAPGNDAAAFAKVLADPEIGGFEVRTAADKDRQVVETEIEELFASRSPDDTVLLYFSGHGLKDDAGNLYLAARNTIRDRLRSTGIADGFLRDVMRTSRARRQVLVLDCCFGGAIARGLLGTKGVGDVVEVNERFQGQGRVILTASTAMEFAFEDDAVSGDRTMSVFTKTLVAGLRSGEADSDADGQVSVQDLYDFAYKRIALPGSKQTPTISSVGQEGSIFVAKVPMSAADRRPGTPLSPVAAGGVGGASGDGLDLRPWVRIRDQGPEGANAAVAAVTALETYLALGGKEVRLSPRYVYQKGKQVMKLDEGSDSGLSLEALATVLEDYGTVPEDMWPYEPGAWKRPARVTWTTLDRAAAEYKAHLIPVTSTSDMAFHLQQGRPVLAGFSVFENTWLAAERLRGRINMPNLQDGQVIGSVATTIVGFDGQTVRIAHTWGQAWGDQGFGEMSVSTAEAMLIPDNVWAVQVGGRFRWKQAGFAPPLSVTPVELTEEKTSAKPRRPRSPAVPAVKTSSGARAVYDGKGEMGDWSKPAAPAGSLARREGDPPTGDAAVDATFDALGVFRAFLTDAFGRDS
jgi:hypothetical protein